MKVDLFNAARELVATVNIPPFKKMPDVLVWGMRVYNLFALRATMPRELALHADPIGPDNNEHLCIAGNECSDLVMAWGAGGRCLNRAAEVVQLYRNRMLFCLDTNEDNSPRHPLYVAATKALEVWRFPD